MATGASLRQIAGLQALAFRICQFGVLSRNWFLKEYSDSMGPATEFAQVPRNVSALSDALFDKEGESGVMLCARSIRDYRNVAHHKNLVLRAQKHRHRTFVKRNKRHRRERHLAFSYVNVVTYIKKLRL